MTGQLQLSMRVRRGDLAMRRDEAVDLLQVMLLDEREPPPLIPKGLDRAFISTEAGTWLLSPASAAGPP
jgi:hypothetical protein